MVLKVSNLDAVQRDIVIGLNSFISPPAGSPDYPLSETAAGILFGLGMAGMGAYLIVRQKRGSKPNI